MKELPFVQSIISTIRLHQTSYDGGTTTESIEYGAKRIRRHDRLKEGPGLGAFIANSNANIGVKERLRKRKTPAEDHPYLTQEMLRGDGLTGMAFDVG